MINTNSDGWICCVVQLLFILFDLFLFFLFFSLTRYSLGALLGHVWTSRLLLGHVGTSLLLLGHVVLSGAILRHVATSGARTGHVAASAVRTGHVAVSGTRTGHVTASGASLGHVTASGASLGHVTASGASLGHGSLGECLVLSSSWLDWSEEVGSWVCPPRISWGWCFHVGPPEHKYVSAVGLFPTIYGLLGTPGAPSTWLSPGWRNRNTDCRRDRSWPDGILCLSPRSRPEFNSTTGPRKQTTVRDGVEQELFIPFQSQ